MLIDHLTNCEDAIDRATDNVDPVEKHNAMQAHAVACFYYLQLDNEIPADVMAPLHYARLYHA